MGQTVRSEATPQATDRRRAISDRNVQAILDAAEELLRSQAPVTIAAVATQAGVSRVTVYAHFATTEALLEAVVERARAHHDDHRPIHGEAMSDQITLTPIGVVRGGRTQIFEDHWGDVTATIVLDPAEVEPDATAGLADFSHIEVVFQFHLAVSTRRGSFHPRGNPAYPVAGVLAGRSPLRPNHLGVSSCELLAVDALELTVRGLDALAGSPVLDVKAYVSEMAPRGEVREPQWITELMRDYY
jgi:tRNA (adenine37-N6)-methyltransferase